jgi:TonB family protein
VRSLAWLVGLACFAGCGAGQEAPPKPAVVCKDDGKGLPPRREGVPYVSPPDGVKQDAGGKGRFLLFVRLDVCIDAGGSVRSAQLDVSSGYPAYDDKVIATVKKWQYCPISGTPMRCGKVSMRWHALAGETH